jgi:hypothetical protein
MNIAPVKTFAILSAIFILTSCGLEKFDLSKFDETLYPSEKKEYFAAYTISFKNDIVGKVFILDGESLFIKDGKPHTLKAGEMLDLDNEKLFKFSILDLINKYPDLNNDRTLRAGNLQAKK